MGKASEVPSSKDASEGFSLQPTLLLLAPLVSWLIAETAYRAFDAPTRPGMMGMFAFLSSAAVSIWLLVRLAKSAIHKRRGASTSFAFALVFGASVFGGIWLGMFEPQHWGFRLRGKVDGACREAEHRSTATACAKWDDSDFAIGAQVFTSLIVDPSDQMHPGCSGDPKSCTRKLARHLYLVEEIFQ